MEELRRIVNQSKLFIIGFSETWLKISTSNNSIERGGFNLLRNDRVGTKGGDVALFIRQSFGTSVLFKSTRLMDCVLSVMTM